MKPEIKLFEERKVVSRLNAKNIKNIEDKNNG